MVSFGRQISSRIVFILVQHFQYAQYYFYYHTTVCTSTVVVQLNVDFSVN